ncbi:MAG: phospholipase D-like domain-containing protein [Euryarchaeota archaeon]|nr:phospholipase D-like domain-containing protein [Euryarchaeota archaeon]
MNGTKITPREILVERNLGEDILDYCWVKNTVSIPSQSIVPILARDRDIILLSKENDLALRLASYANDAKDMICVSSYLIQGSPFTDAMIEAAKRGVRCYVITSREDELKVDPDEVEGKNKNILDEHRHLLDSLAGYVLVRTAPHFHAKFALFDPKGKQPCGIMATCNFTVDAMKGGNVEVALTLTSAEVQSVYNQFVHGFWAEPGHELMTKGTLNAISRKDIVEDALEHVIHPCTVGELRGLQDIFLEVIRNAKRTLIIGSWTIEPEHPVTKAIEEAARTRVAVTVMTRPRDVNTQMAMALGREGVKILGMGIHAKFVIADGENAVVATANISKKGMDEGFEVGVRLSKPDSKALDAMMKSVANSAEWTFFDHVKVKELKEGPIKRWNEKAKVLQELPVSEKFEQRGENVNVALAILYKYQQETAALTSPNNGDGKAIYRTVSKKVIVTPNSLPSAVEPVEVISEGMLVAKGQRGELYIPVANQEDIEVALIASKERSATAVFAPVDRINGLKNMLDKGKKMKGKGKK